MAVREPPLQGSPGSTPTVDPLYRRTFVGRENETRQLHQAYDAAVSGQGGLVMVVGEPGIGKTAICEQLATYVQLRGGKTLVGHCYEEGSLSLPYLAFVEAMRSYVLARDPEALRSELGTGAAEVARIVSEVRDRVHLELRDASDPEDDRWRLLNAISTFLRNAASVQPLVIVLEDLHWADRGTLDLLLHVARNLDGVRMLIVGTYRDVEIDRQHPLSATLADLRRINTFLRVPLRGLTVDEVHRMYEAIRGNSVPWSQAELVHRATEGNPLFVQEILRYLVEEGFVVRQDGQYVSHAPGEGIPDGLRDVVGRRLTHLSEQTNQVLSVASVIGRDFRLDVLQQVAPHSEDEVVQALEEASERSIIEQSRSIGAVTFRFTHAFFRQVLYEELFAPRRIRWHQQVGTTLEDVYGRRLEEHAAELAEHFSQSTEAQDLEKAIKYGQIAAGRSMAVFAYSEAVRHLEQALRAQEILALEDSEARSDLLLDLGDALMLVGEPLRVAKELAPEVYDTAKRDGDGERAERSADMALEALHRAGLGNPTVLSGSTPEFRLWAERVAESALPGTRRRCLADIAIARLHFGKGELREAGELLDGALALARQLDDPELLFTAAWHLVRCGLNTKRWQDSVSVGVEFVSRPREGVSPRTVCQILEFGGVALLASGDGEGARGSWSELSVLAERTRDPWNLGNARSFQGMMAILDGRLEEAAAIGRELWSESGFGGTVFVRAAGIGRCARALLYLGLTGELRDLNNNLASLAELAYSGQAESVRSLIEQSNLLERSLGEPVDLQSLVLGLEAATAIGDADLAERLLVHFPVELPFVIGPGNYTCYARHVAAALQLLGRSEQAKARFEEAIRRCELARFRPELALSHLGLAELLLDHYPDEHDAAIEHLDFAIGEFREMKMQPALERALGRRGLLKA